VYISYARAEVDAAERLYRALPESGLDCFLDLGLTAGELCEKALQQALDRSRALVVL
jgi:hypothetical protein